MPWRCRSSAAAATAASAAATAASAAAAAASSSAGEFPVPAGTVDHVPAPPCHLAR